MNARYINISAFIPSLETLVCERIPDFTEQFIQIKNETTLGSTFNWVQSWPHYRVNQTLSVFLIQENSET